MSWDSPEAEMSSEHATPLPAEGCGFLRTIRLQRVYDVRMGTDRANPRIAELRAEVEEDLTKYRDALRTLGRPESATDVSAEIARSTGVMVGPQAAKWRLDKLVSDLGEARRTSATSGRKRFLYELLPIDQ